MLHDRIVGAEGRGLQLPTQQGFPSGQRGRAVNPLAQPSEVRILPPASPPPGLQSGLALLAQSVEHLHGKEGVDGSSPSEGLAPGRVSVSRDGSPVILLEGQAAGLRSAHGGASQWLRGNPRRRPRRSPPRAPPRAGKKSKGFTDEERAAMKERAKELKAEARANKNKADGESDVLAKIAEMPEPDRAMAKRLHAIIKASAPALSPKTWYGMPAYAKDGKVVCFFQSAQKFNDEVRDVRLQRRGEPRRRRHVADLLRAEGVDRRRRGKDRRAREESGELRGRGRARELVTAHGLDKPFQQLERPLSGPRFVSGQIGSDCRIKTKNGDGGDQAIVGRQPGRRRRLRFVTDAARRRRRFASRRRTTCGRPSAPAP